MTDRHLTRRSALTLLAVGALAGCTPATHPNGEKAISSPASALPTPTPTPVQNNAAFSSLEDKFRARLGLWALDTSTMHEIVYRPDERFAFCSTGKAVLAAKVLATRTSAGMGEVVRFTQADLIAHSPITTKHLATGMTVLELCDAAVRYSDNAAANLLFASIGGPIALQQFVRQLGDSVTNMSRTEPALSYAVPNDPQDTTTPRAWGKVFQELLLGSTLASAQRKTLTDWLIDNTTGATLIRKSTPTGWTVADKTGSGWYGTRNDIGVLWPPKRKPIVMALMSSRTTQGATIDDDLIAQSAATVLATLQ